MDEAQRLYEERQSIIEMHQQVETSPSSAQLFTQQVDTLIHTLQHDEWGAFQEYHQEQLQNAQEAEWSRQQALESSRHMQEPD